MQVLLLEEISFWEVIWWMILVFFATMFIWMFIAVFADIFRRDMSGIAKALWILLIFMLPLLGVLLYMIFRGPPTEAEMQQMQQAQRAMSGTTPADEIAKAQQLLSSGAINQAEFDELKRRAMR